MRSRFDAFRQRLGRRREDGPPSAPSTGTSAGASTGAGGTAGAGAAPPLYHMPGLLGGFGDAGLLARPSATSSAGVGSKPKDSNFSFFSDDEGD